MSDSRRKNIDVKANTAILPSNWWCSEQYRDMTYRRIRTMRAQGHSIRDTARAIGCSDRTVTRLGTA